MVNFNKEQARKDFETEGLSLSQIAEKYGVSYSLVSKYSAKESWHKKKDIIAKTIEKKLKVETDHIAEIAIAEMKPEFEKKAKQAIAETLSIFEVNTKIVQKITELAETMQDSKDASNLANALKNCQHIQRLELGLFTEKAETENITEHKISKTDRAEVKKLLKELKTELHQEFC